MLTKNQLKQLRNEIVLNSVFLKDYDNSFYITHKRCIDFFDSYIEDLCDQYNNIDFIDILDRYDNIDNLYNYYMGIGCDALIRDDYIAYYALNIYESIVIYKIDNGIDDYALTGYIGSLTKDNKLTYNKIYYAANGDAYIKKFNRRYYLKNFTKKYI